MELTDQAYYAHETNADFRTLDFIYNGGETLRYHTLPLLRHQKMGAHQYNVAMLCWWLSGSEMPGTSINLILAALTHDLSEHIMGDLPAPTKREMPGYLDGSSFRDVWGHMEDDLLLQAGLSPGPLTEREARILALADAADGCLYCARELMMGNTLILPCYAKFASYYQALLGPRPAEPRPEDILGDYIVARRKGF